MVFILVSCSEEDDLGPPDEEFIGTYMVRDLSVVIDDAKIDSIVFSTQRNTTYRMMFYESSSADTVGSFCYCEGSMIDFGTAKVTFAPTLIIRENCDTLRIPRGLFEADFRTHGDTVYITKIIRDLERWGTGVDSTDYLYELKLLKTK